MNAHLREELLQRLQEEQKLRLMWIDKPEDPQLIKQVYDVDQQNTAWLKSIIEQYGWPGNSLVDHDGANAAFLIVQHSPSLEFQKQCLSMIEKAVENNDASSIDMAYLKDRVLLAEGQKQIYGTQGIYQDGVIIPSPIEDEEKVDERRSAIGLEPIAKYFQYMNKVYKTQPNNSTDT